MPEPTHSLQNALTHLVKQINDIEGTLRAQHNVLRQRGMTLPTGVLDNLVYMRSDLEALTNSVVTESTEVERLQALAKTTELINSSLDPDEVLTEVVDQAIALTGAERGYIMLRSAQTGEMAFRVARNFNRQTLHEGQLTASETIMNQAIASRRPVVSEDAMLDERFDSSMSIIMRATRSVICVPLIFKDEITGVLYADNQRRTNLFGEDEQSLLMAFANQAAIAIENARLFARAKVALDEVTEMKDFLDNVLASIASGVITTDINDKIIIYNAAAERILGVPSEQAIGQSLVSVMPEIFASFAEITQSVQVENREQVIEIEPVLPNRGAVNLSLKLAPLQDENDMIYGTAVVVDDLTEIKKRDATLNVVRTYLPQRLLTTIESIDSLGLSGDEREISVIFADVRGFTTFSEQLAPERLMEVISKYLTVSSDAIELHDGVIDKYMGDAIVGLFNTQLNPQADHAVRAVRAALSMAYDVRALHEILPPEERLLYGIGVDSGMAMLGNVGSPSRKEFTAIGQPFNFSKLLQENADGGETIISQTTYDLVKHVFEAEPLTPRKVKDYAGFQVMYRVTGIKR
ncbi:MAG: GAF domain-containing protein [Anaerolineae bacterium]|nr:GAF domain-containing protein [Anaerolineae bacterium]